MDHIETREVINKKEGTDITEFDIYGNSMYSQVYTWAHNPNISEQEQSDSGIYQYIEVKDIDGDGKRTDSFGNVTDRMITTKEFTGEIGSGCATYT